MGFFRKVEDCGLRFLKYVMIGLNAFFMVRPTAKSPSSLCWVKGWTGYRGSHELFGPPWVLRASKGCPLLISPGLSAVLAVWKTTYCRTLAASTKATFSASKEPRQAGWTPPVPGLLSQGGDLGRMVPVSFETVLEQPLLIIPLFTFISFTP
jgi:hypothetical protein